MIRGVDGRLAVHWGPILAAARDLCAVGGDATALGGALGRLLDTIPVEVLDRRRPTGTFPAAYLAEALTAFLHRGEFARFHGLPELLAATCRVDPDRVSVSVEPGPRLRMEIRGQAGEQWTDYAAGRTAAEHVYLSTGCLHGEHDYCKSMVGAQGEKRPARCKFCDAQCRCSCHVGDGGGR